MVHKKLALMSAFLSIVLAGSTAFAQSATSTLAVTSNPVSTSVTPGTGVSLGTVTLTSPGGSYTVNSIPVNLAISGGALAGNLSNCALYNNSSANASTTSALGPMSAIVSGSNSFSLSPALTVNSGSPVTLQIRCDVSSSAPSGSIFQFTTSTSTTSVGNQVAGASLSAETDFVKQIPAGLNNAIIGIITLDASKSNQAITLNQVPIAVTASGGATLDALTNCTLTSTTGSVLTTGGNAVGAITGSNMFKLDTPLTVAAGQGALLVMRCNVSTNAPVGSTLTVGFSPSSFQAMAGGSPVSVTQGMMANGQQGTNSGVITIAPQGSQSQSVGSPAIPGAPNTGAGGEAGMVYSILLASLLVALIAGREMLRTR